MIRLSTNCQSTRLVSWVSWTWMIEKSMTWVFSVFNKNKHFKEGFENIISKSKELTTQETWPNSSLGIKLKLYLISYKTEKQKNKWSPNLKNQQLMTFRFWQKKKSKCSLSFYESTEKTKSLTTWCQMSKNL